jgi:hypothetical protein
MPTKLFCYCVSRDRAHGRRTGRASRLVHLWLCQDGQTPSFVCVNLRWLNPGDRVYDIENIRCGSGFYRG